MDRDRSELEAAFLVIRAGHPWPADGPTSKSRPTRSGVRLPRWRGKSTNVQMRHLQALRSSSGSSVRPRNQPWHTLDLAWADAFATGRVLVVERINEDWRFRAPGHWRSKPPFAATAPRRALAAATRDITAASETAIRELTQGGHTFDPRALRQRRPRIRSLR